MDQETERFVCGAFCGLIGGVIAWALFLWMLANIMDRI